MRRLSSSLNLLRPPSAALHASFGAKAPHWHLCLRDFLSQSLELVANARVEDHVANLQHDAAQDVLVDVALQLDRLTSLVLDLPPDLLDHVRWQLDGARQRHLQAALLLPPHLVESAPDAEDDGHAVLLREEL